MRNLTVLQRKMSYIPGSPLCFMTLDLSLNCTLGVKSAVIDCLVLITEF